MRLNMDELQYSKDVVANVRKFFDKDAKTIKEDVMILKKWMAQQQHLPRDPSDDFLERLLLRNKFRVEQAKKKLDNYYTLRALYKRYYLESSSSIVPSKENSMLTPLPGMTPSNERIIISNVESSDPDKFTYSHVIRNMNLVMEIVMRNDYSVGEVILVDMQGVTVDHIKKMTVAEMSHSLELYMRAYSGRILGLHIFNTPSYVNILMAILKLAFPAKIYQKIKIHKSLESLHESIDKKLLPREYGGELGSLIEIKKKWDKVFEGYYKFFDSNYHNVSNEKLRVGEVARNEVFGVEGTFKKLNLD